MRTSDALAALDTRALDPRPAPLTYHQRAVKAATTRWGSRRTYGMADLTDAQRDEVGALIARFRAENKAAR